MKVNVGNWDRTARIVLGVVLLGLVLFKAVIGWWAVILAVLSAPLLASAITGY